METEANLNHTIRQAQGQKRTHKNDHNKSGRQERPQVQERQQQTD